MTRMFFLSIFLFLSFLYFVPSFANEKPGYRIDFANAVQKKKTISNWAYKGKPGTQGASFTLVELDGVKVLKLTSHKGTGTLMFDISKVDLVSYPYMRWKWKVSAYPQGADGRHASKDDQAITLYIGSGTLLSQHSVAYRWDTETPKQSSGFIKYALGAVKVNWTCVRNVHDGTDIWQIDECNALEEMTRLFKGKLPKTIILSLSTNSQYTASTSEAYLEYIEFHSAPMKKGKCKNEIYRETQKSMAKK